RALALRVGTSATEYARQTGNDLRHGRIRRGRKGVRMYKGAKATAVVGALSFAAALGSGSANAQVAWDGSNSSDWFDAGNWVGGVLPTGATDAVIDAGAGRPAIVGAPGAAAQAVVVGNTGT